MALTADMIKGNEALKALTNDQIAAIVAVSATDEGIVIGRKVGEIHAAYDKDIEDITGVKRETGKTYNYLKEVLGKYKADAEALPGVRTELEEVKKNKSTDDQLKADYEKLKGDFTTLSGKITKMSTDHATALAEKEATLNRFRVEAELEKGLSGIAFKTTIPPTVVTTVVDAAKQKVMGAHNTDFLTEGGTTQLVFRDKITNEILRAPGTLQPLSAKDLLTKELSEVIDSGRQQQGAGSKPTGGGGSNVPLDITGATTQVAADEKIAEHLLSEGLLRGTSEFTTKQLELRRELKVETLPMN